MTSSMIARESNLTPLSVPDKPSIERSPQLVIQSENIPIAATPTSPILTPEKQSTEAICISADKNLQVESVSHKDLSLTTNTQKINAGLESSKINNSSIDNQIISPRVVSPPTLSEPFSNSIKGSASISGNNGKPNNTSDEIQPHTEESSFSENHDLAFATKIETNNGNLQSEQSLANLSEHSTHSPPCVPFNTNEIHIKQHHSGIIIPNNYQDSNNKVNGYESQVTPVYYPNGYPISSNSPDNFNKNTQYYASPIIGAPLYAQYPPSNTQLYASNQKSPSYYFVKQQKNSKIPKVPYQQVYIWNPQQPNPQSGTSYQYYQYTNPQTPKQLNANYYNVYNNNYQHFTTLNEEIAQQSYNSSNNINFKPNIYDNNRLSPVQFSANSSMSHLPYHLPNQDQQQYFNPIVEDHHMNQSSSIPNFALNGQNLNSNAFQSPQDDNTSQVEATFSSNQSVSKSRSKSSLKTLKMHHSLHNHHHQVPNTELVPPKPIYYNDKTLGRYGIRCVCGKGSITIGNDSISSSSLSNTNKKRRKSKKNKNKTEAEQQPDESNETINADPEPEAGAETGNTPSTIHSNTLLVQCSICHFWLHGLCVNVARILNDDHYVCPFCSNKRIFCTKCGENMNYSDPLIRCTKCGFWVHKECEGLIFGINPSGFVCRNCGGLSEDATYNMPSVHFIPTKRRKADITPNDISLLLNNNKSSKEEDKNESDEDLDAFFEREIPDNTVFTSHVIDNEFQTQILAAIPDGVFKKMVIYDLNKSELEFRPTIEKYFHMFAPLLFDYSHEFWRVFKDTLSRILRCNSQTILNSIDSLANHLIYMPTSVLSINNTFIDNNDNENKVFYRSQKTKKKLFTNSESITKYLENQNMTRIEKQPQPVTLYCDKSDSRVYSSSSLDENAFIADITGFLMHTDEVRVEEEGIPKTCFLVTDMDLIIDTRGTEFEFFAPRIRRSFHFNTVVKLVRIQGEIRLCLFAMKMKSLLSSEEKLKKGPVIQAGGEIILPLDGTIPYPVNKIQWKDKKKHQKASSSTSTSSTTNNSNSNLNSNESDANNLNANNENEIDDADDEIDLNSSSSHSKAANQSVIMTRNQERKKKAELKLEKKSRDDQISKLTLLSSFYDDSVEAFPFILLDDDEAVEKYKSQKQSKPSRSKNGKGKR